MLYKTINKAAERKIKEVLNKSSWTLAETRNLKKIGRLIDACVECSFEGAVCKGCSIDISLQKTIKKL